MKKITITALGCLLSAGCFAQQFSIENTVMREKDGLVHISFDARMQPVGKNERITLTPILYQGTDSLRLRPIAVSGRKKAISDRRKGVTPGERTGKKLEHTVVYTTSVPSELWMDSLSLHIESETETCCQVAQWPDLAVTTDVEMRFQIKPVYPKDTMHIPFTELQLFDKKTPFLHPIEEYKTGMDSFDSTTESGALLVYFKQGASAVDLSYKNNAGSLEQVKKVLDLIEADHTATLEKIVLAGAASPEGRAEANFALAGKRAEALKQFLKKDFREQSNLFEVVNLGENWEALHQMVEGDTNMPGREEALAIIDGYTVEAGREAALMKLKGGQPYRYMKEHFFPELRNAGYIQIYYESKPDTTVQEINRAVRLINEKQYAQALQLLQPLKREPRTDNLMGVCLMMMHQYTEAEGLLNRAIEAGDADAPRNLEQLHKTKAMNDN